MNILRLNNYNLRTTVSKPWNHVGQLIAPASTNMITRSYLTKSSPLALTTHKLNHSSSYNSGNIKSLLLIKARYSTRTAPPPPPPSPPPSDKNLKGKRILNRISRAFTFSASTLLVIGAAGVAVLVLYLIISELFFPLGDTRTFNKAVDLIQQNEEAQKILGFTKGERLKAYGIVSADKWVRNRPVQSIKRKNPEDGKDHLYMKFKVETATGAYGVVTLEQIDDSWWSTKFKYIALDVPGHRTVYVIAPPRPKVAPSIGKGTGFLGLNWGPKKD